MDFNVLKDTKEVNGHFDPMSLSISESIEDRTWRKRTGILSGFGIGSKIFDEWKSTNNRDILASLTSSHEQEHFKRYSSSEIGLLLTFVYQLKSNVLYAYIKTKNERMLYANSLYDTILNSFYTCKHTQQEAVDALNEFYAKFSGINEKIFTTKNPTSPSSPHSIFGFNHILEASAVLDEIAMLSCTFGKDNERHIDLLRHDARDQDLYFDLINYLIQELNYYPAVSMVVRYSLDSRVPIIGSPLKGTIDWEDFHPGCRLVCFFRALKDILESNGLMDLKFKNDKHEYWVKIQEQFFHYTHYAGKEGGKLTMWDDKDVVNYDIDTDILINSMTEKGKNFVSLNLDKWKPIMDHLYDSYKIFRNTRVENPLLFYTSVLIGLKDDDLDKVNQVMASHAYALFSIFNGSIESYHSFLEKDVYSAIWRLMEYKVIKSFLMKEPKDFAKNTIIEKYSLGIPNSDNPDPEMQKKFAKSIDLIVSDIYE